MDDEVDGRGEGGQEEVAIDVPPRQERERGQFAQGVGRRVRVHGGGTRHARVEREDQVERLRIAQRIAIGIAAAAVVVIIVAVGTVPWIALTLAASFATYGLVKKQIGPAVDALSGLTLESLWLIPIAVIQLIVVATTTGLTMGQVSGGHTFLLLLAGVITGVPLLFFAAGARRTTLTVVGILQFIAPIMQFLTGVLILGEPMPAERWAGFALVWTAIAIFTVDSVVHSRRQRSALAAGVSDPV